MGQHITSLTKRVPPKRRVGQGGNQGKANCLPPPERSLPLPHHAILGITWKQRHALTRIRLLEQSLIRNVTIWVGPQELATIEEIERLYQTFFPSDWARAQEKATIQRAAKREEMRELGKPQRNEEEGEKSEEEPISA